MQNKQIYAAMEINDHNIRLIVGEFYENRFNILRVETVKVSGVENKKIVNEEMVVSSIIKAVNNASAVLGYKIHSILLAIPSVNVKKFNKRVNVLIKEANKIVKLSHIQQGINEVINFRPDGELELVNLGCIKYISNGISSRKMPLNEYCDMLTMDVDLLYADKEIVYSYARCVEKAGLSILDICLDSYAIAEEAAIFEQTVDKYVILVDLERQSTTLSLFTHGKLVSCDVLETGYGDWLEPLRENHTLTTDVAFRLIQDNFKYHDENEDDNICYIYAREGKEVVISEKEIYHSIAPKVDEWIENINFTCQGIVDAGDVKYLLTGEGLEIQGLEKVLDKLNAEAKVYVPQTIGGRKCSLVTTLGLFYAWKTMQQIRNDENTSVDSLDVERVVRSSKDKLNDEHGFTRKLKNMILNDK